MVRDNWQTRVENADARRQESKQRKHRDQEKRLAKGRVQELLWQLDDYYASYMIKEQHQFSAKAACAVHAGPGEKGKKQNSSNRRHVLDHVEMTTLHIWFEPDGNTKNALLSVLSTVGDGPRRKARSSSVGNCSTEGGRGRSDSLTGAYWSGSLGSGDGHADEIIMATGGTPPSAATGRKGRGRSESFGGGSGSSTGGKNKKLHPRSNNNKELVVTFHHTTEAQVLHAAAAADGPWLCKKDFFHGKCGNGSSACRHVHYSCLSASASHLLSSCCLTGTSLVTLESVLKKMSKFKNTPPNFIRQELIQAQLQESETAATRSSTLMADTTAGAASSSTAMDLLCHTAIDLSQLVVTTASSPTTSPLSTTSSSSLSELVTTTLSTAGEHPISLSSIVYVVLHGTLVFDRNRNGILTMPGNNSNSNNIAEGYDRRRASSIGSECDTTETGVCGLDTSSHYSRSTAATAAAFDFQLLPGPILEHMLTFLPDTAVAACAQTCKAWYHEIGQCSPNLWLHLLQRRNWPLPPSPLSLTTITTTSADDDDDHANGVHDENEHANRVQRDLEAHRSLFLKHYSAMRDVRAMGGGITELLSNHSSSSSNAMGRRQQQERQRLHKEMTLVDFTKHGRKFAPPAQDVCVALLEWSPKRILVGYANECSLRLFEAVPSTGSGGGASTTGPENMRCKELVYQSVDPLACTKKRKCYLKAVAMDEERIGCLCSATWTDTSALRPVQRERNEFGLLVVLNRDDFLLGESSAVITKGGSKQQHAAGQVDKLKVIDIGQSILNYVLTSDITDHRYFPLFDFLSDGGHVDDVIVQASWSLAACGYGRFLVEVGISLPGDDMDYGADATDDDPPGLLLDVDRFLVLFSSDAEAILWMIPCKPSIDIGWAVFASSPLYQSQPLLSTSSMVQNQAMSDYTGMFTIAIRTNCQADVLVLDIDTSPAKGYFASRYYEPRLIQESCLVHEEILVRQQLAENTTVMGGEQVQWRFRLCGQLVVTSTDIISADCLQRYIISDHGDANEIQLLQGPRMPILKAILTFYPRYRPPGQAPCETLSLPGNLCVKEMVTVRNDHVVAVCSELRIKTPNDDNRLGVERNEQGLLISADDEVEEQEDLVGNEDGDSDDILNGEASHRRRLLFRLMDANNNNGNDRLDDASDTTPLEQEYWEESLVLVVIHVPSRCEIGRVPLCKTTTMRTLDQQDRSRDYCWRPKMSFTTGKGGTIALALDAAGIVLTGEAVRSLGQTCTHLGNSTGGSVDAETKSPAGGARRKKKNVRKGGSGKKDGFARGMTLRG